MRPNLVRAPHLSATVVALLLAAVAPAEAQIVIRGLYPPMFATNSGVQPSEGSTYQRLFQLYSFDELMGPDRQDLRVNETASPFVPQNIVMWVSEYKLFGGTYAVTVILPVTNSSLASVAFGTIAGRAGFADSYDSPFGLGWNEKRADLQAGYGFMAPTGRLKAGATGNTGTGYWGHFLTAGQTVCLTADKGTAASAFEVYEFHTTQQTTNVDPGQTFDIDYSLTQLVPLDTDQHTLRQFAGVGYGQYQLTDLTGPGVNPIIASNSHYRVNAVGPGTNVLLPARRVVVGAFQEFANAPTVQGHSLQISATVTF